MKPLQTESSSWRKILAVLVGLICTLNVAAQQINVKGSVTDQHGDPVIGATIMEQGTKNGVVTDIDGNFALSVASPKSRLRVTYIGYKTQELPVNNQTDFKIKLQEDAANLDEVVVVGYGTMDKKELTSAVSHVSSKNFTQVASVDPSMMIQGKVAGVSITNTGAGDPNNQASIQVRGVSSRAAGLGPLIVIDGVPGGNLTNINPNDIESYDVLKDGAASAIYGTRGSNGVILVTTKKGARDGNLHTSYNGSIALDVIKKDLDMLSPDEYRANRLASGTGYDLGGSTDWMKGVSRVGVRTVHTLTLSGGNIKSNYRASVDYRDAKGIDKYSGRQEYGARISLNHTTNSGLITFGLNIAPRVAYRKNATWDVFRNALEANPTTPIWDPQNPTLYYNFKGQPAEWNPIEQEKRRKDTGTTKLIDWDGTVKLNLFPLLLTILESRC